MKTIFVSPHSARADARSLSEALQQAQPGDVVLVEPGRYSPSLTGERLPLTLPPGVHVQGAARQECIIDGEGHFSPSFQPIRPEQSVVVLKDGTSLSGVTVTQGGGHGIGVPPSASVTVRSCTISNHGDHGIFLCGVTAALITDCDFSDNGLERFEPSLPRGTGARQGHHVFAEARAGQRNQLSITGNIMRRCFADGLAFICFFPEPDGVSFDATVLRNTIEDCERGGLLFSCSFGPSSNRQSLTVADNILRGNKQFGINILTAIPLADKVPQQGQLTALLAGNTIANSPVGIAVHGALGEAQHNTCRVVIDRNEIADWKAHAIRLVGGSGLDNVETTANQVVAALSRNVFNGQSPAVVIQGASGTTHSHTSQNRVTARVLANDLDSAGDQPILVSDGRPDNHAEVQAAGDPYTRKDEDLLG
ncbi:MAG: right-handed parallel beta-helix repeat-containing protein [Desulfurellaceae bacterium]|nr:right-handed parallel beta-helix repeat-containing protein [Desulfurellaceae bacterium]